METWWLCPFPAELRFPPPIERKSVHSAHCSPLVGHHILTWTESILFHSIILTSIKRATYDVDETEILRKPSMNMNAASIECLKRNCVRQDRNNSAVTLKMKCQKMCQKRDSHTRNTSHRRQNTWVKRSHRAGNHITFVSACVSHIDDVTLKIEQNVKTWKRAQSVFNWVVCTGNRGPFTFVHDSYPCH